MISRTPDPTSRPRIAVLDGLRGLAIAMVVIFHLHQDVPTLWPGTTAFGERGIVAHTLDFFLLGVDLFYVLSGFFIGYAVLKPAVWAPLAFLSRRLTRILPAYYLSLAVTLILVQQQHFQTLQGWIDIGLHLLMLHSFQEWSLFSINGAYWTLGIEFTFYGLMLALGPVWRARRGAWLPAVFLAICLLWRAAVWVSIPVDKRYFWSAQIWGALDEFAFGMAVAYLYHRGWFARLSVRWGVVLGLAGCSLVLGCLGYYVTMTGNYWESAFAVVLSRSVLSLGFALWVASFLTLQRHAKFTWVVQHSQSARLGEISYSVYLYHTPIIFLSFTYGQRWLTPFWLLLVTCGLIGVVSAASYRWVERRWHPEA